MKKIYKYENATIIVLNPNVNNMEILQKSTESFLRNVIKERSKYGNCNTSGNNNKQ